MSRALRCKVCLGLTTGFLKGANAAEMGSRAYAAQHARGWTTSKMTGKTSTKTVCSRASPPGATSPGLRCKVCAGLKKCLREGAMGAALPAFPNPNPNPNPGLDLTQNESYEMITK